MILQIELLILYICSSEYMLSPQFQIGQELPAGKDDFLAIVQRIGTPATIKKGKVLVRQHSAASFFFLITSGIFKTYFTKGGKQYIIGFTFPGDIDCCPTSLLNDRPNNFSIEAITDAQVLICELEDFRNACSEKEYLAFVNSLLITYMGVIESRMADSISLTATDRYRQLLQLQPDAVKLIPLKYIAAYLGITLQGLSRIRKKFKV